MLEPALFPLVIFRGLQPGCMPLKDLVPARPPLTPFEQLLDKHLPLAWRQTDKRRRQVRLVAAGFLVLPETMETKERRKQAQKIVTALLPDVEDLQTVQQKCHKDTFEAEIVNNNRYHREFDSRLDDIESDYDSELNHSL